MNAKVASLVVNLNAKVASSVVDMNAKVASPDEKNAYYSKGQSSPSSVHGTLFANANNKSTPLTLNQSLMTAILAGNSEQFKVLLHAPQMQPNNPWQPAPIDVFIVTAAAVKNYIPSPAFLLQKDGSLTEDESVRITLQKQLGLQPQMIVAIMANPVILALICNSPTSNTFGARIDIIGELKARRPDLFNKAGNDLLQLRTNNAITDEHYEKANSALETSGGLGAHAEAEEENVHSMAPA